MNIPYDTFKNPVCRGDPALRNNCGHCEKCIWIANQTLASSTPKFPIQRLLDAFTSFQVEIQRANYEVLKWKAAQAHLRERLRELGIDDKFLWKDE